MKSIAKRREIVNGSGRIRVDDEIIRGLMEIEGRTMIEVVREEMFGLFKRLIERAMQLEIEEFLGYAPYQKDHRGSNGRNGYRERKRFILKEGTLRGISIPRDRESKYKTAILPNAKKYEPSLMNYIQQLYMNCNSTRPLSKMATQLFDWPMSPEQVSTICKAMDKEVEEWKKRPLPDKYVGLFMDAVWLPLRRYRQKSEKECMLLVLGITEDGLREVIGMRLVGEESSEAWKDLLMELKDRGLKGKELALAVTDGVAGLKDVLRKLFPGLAVQRCIVHKERNVLRYVPQHSKQIVAEALKGIYSSFREEDALKRKDEFCEKWRKIFPSAVRSLETDFEDSITYLKIKDFQLRKLFCSNNPIERINKEIKRRVRVMEMLPAEESAYRIVYWVVQNLEKGWRLRRVRGYAYLGDLKSGFTH